MNIYGRIALAAICLQLAGCASTGRSWWDAKEAQGKPGQAWKQRYTTYSFSSRHENAHRDATRQLERWAEWKCPVAGYETRYIQVIEDPSPTRSSGLLAMYYGLSTGIRKSFTVEMAIRCRHPDNNVNVRTTDKQSSHITSSRFGG